MKNLDIILLHGPFHDAVGADLPDVVVGTHSAQPLLPEPGPSRPVVIQEMYTAVFRVFRNPGLYRMTVALAGQYPEFEILRHFQHPVPAHTYLASESRLAGIPRHKYLLLHNLTSFYITYINKKRQIPDNNHCDNPRQSYRQGSHRDSHDVISVTENMPCHHSDKGGKHTRKEIEYD